MPIVPWDVETKKDKDGRLWAFSWTYCDTPKRKAMFAKIVNEKLHPPVPVTVEMVDHNEQPMEGATMLYTTALLFDPTASTTALAPAAAFPFGWLVSFLTKLFGRRSLAAT